MKTDVLDQLSYHYRRLFRQGSIKTQEEFHPFLMDNGSVSQIPTATEMLSQTSTSKLNLKSSSSSLSSLVQRALWYSFATCMLLSYLNYTQNQSQWYIAFIIAAVGFFLILALLRIFTKSWGFHRGL